MAVARERATDWHTDREEEMSGGEILCRALEAEGVRLIFGYPGGAIMPFYDALYGFPGLRHVLVRHEQGATHAAEGYARITGEVGVCVGTSGPGATNMVTGLANAFMDSVPLVAITGQVARAALGKDSFQETDVLGLSLAVTKHSILVQRAEDLAGAVHEAFTVARSGRPGPVLLDIPKDVQSDRTSHVPHPPGRRGVGRPPVDRGQVEDAVQLLQRARRPIILAGHGIILSGGCGALRCLAEQSGIPVSLTLLGLSAFPASHPLYLGMPGMHGGAAVNRALNEADVILAVGMRFDDRVTGKVSQFAPQARIIHIDIDAAELEKVVPTAIAIHGDAREVLECLTERLPRMEHTAWVQQARGTTVTTTPERTEIPRPDDIFAAIKRATADQAVVVSDVGQHQMWVAQKYGFDRPNTHITSGGLGTMGFSLPAAMGVKLGKPEALVWVIAGDGGIQMNIQELATIADQDLDLKVVIINNGYLGMVRQWQEFFHGGRYSCTPISSPDYVLLAEAYGHKARQVTRADELDEVMRWAAHTPGCVIVDVVVEGERNVYPMIPSGASVATMIEEPED